MAWQRVALKNEVEESQLLALTLAWLDSAIIIIKQQQPKQSKAKQLAFGANGKVCQGAELF